MIVLFRPSVGPQGVRQCCFSIYLLEIFISSLQVAYPGYKPFTETVSVAYNLDKFTALTRNFQLEKSASTTILEATEPTCPSPEVRHRENYGPALLPSAITALTALALHTLLLWGDGWLIWLLIEWKSAHFTCTATWAMFLSWYIFFSLLGSFLPFKGHERKATDSEYCI